MNDLYSIYRCVDCKAMQAVPRGGGNLLECCDVGEAREMEFVQVTVDTDWKSITSITGANPIRATLTGPPAICWIQGRDAYGLYVKGKRVKEWDGAYIDTCSHLELVNEVLAAT